MNYILGSAKAAGWSTRKLSLIMGILMMAALAGFASTTFAQTPDPAAPAAAAAVAPAAPDAAAVAKAAEAEAAAFVSAPAAHAAPPPAVAPAAPAAAKAAVKPAKKPAPAPDAGATARLRAEISSLNERLEAAGDALTRVTGQRDAVENRIATLENSLRTTRAAAQAAVIPVVWYRRPAVVVPWVTIIILIVILIIAVRTEARLRADLGNARWNVGRLDNIIGVKADPNATPPVDATGLRFVEEQYTELVRVLGNEDPASLAERMALAKRNRLLEQAAVILGIKADPLANPPVQATGMYAQLAEAEKAKAAAESRVATVARDREEIAGKLGNLVKVVGTDDPAKIAAAVGQGMTALAAIAAAEKLVDEALAMSGEGGAAAPEEV